MAADKRTQYTDLQHESKRTHKLLKNENCRDNKDLVESKRSPVWALVSKNNCLDDANQLGQRVEGYHNTSTTKNIQEDYHPNPQCFQK